MTIYTKAYVRLFVWARQIHDRMYRSLDATIEATAADLCIPVETVRDVMETEEATQ